MIERHIYQCVEWQMACVILRPASDKVVGTDPKVVRTDPKVVGTDPKAKEVAHL